MIEKLNNDNSLQELRKERYAVTVSIFYCRASADFSVSYSNKHSCNLTRQCFEISKKIYRQKVNN